MRALNGRWPVYNKPPDQVVTMVLYMCFDKFLLAVESRDLSQADKIIIRVPSFSIVQNLNFQMIKFSVLPKKNYLALGNFGKSDIKVTSFLVTVSDILVNFICKIEK